jgi:hypothetical protein
MTDAEENAAHGLEIECVVTAEDQREASKLHTKRLDRLSLSGTGRSVGRTAETLAESLCEGKEAAICERSADQTIRNTQVLKSVVQRGIGHLDLEALQQVISWLIDISHGQQPHVVSWRLRADLV